MVWGLVWIFSLMIFLNPVKYIFIHYAYFWNWRLLPTCPFTSTLNLVHHHPSSSFSLIHIFSILSHLRLAQLHLKLQPPSVIINFIVILHVCSCTPWQCVFLYVHGCFPEIAARVECYTPFFPTTHTHSHTPAVLEDLSEVSWLGPRLGTPLPNHIAASKSSVYISNYTVACGVLEHSGRSPFHLCAVSKPLPHLPYFLPSRLSSIHIYLVIYLFPSGLSLLLFQLAAALICPAIALLWTQHRRAKPTVGGSRIIFDDLFIVLLQFAGFHNIISIQSCLTRRISHG